jgi:hypothetical protein
VIAGVIAPALDGDLGSLVARLTSARDPRTVLRLIGALRRELDDLERTYVERAFAAGVSGAAVGRDLGVSRQVVHRRHGDLVPQDGARRARVNDKLTAVRSDGVEPLSAGLSVTAEAQLVLRHASAEAEASGDASIGAEHLLLALLRPGAVAALEEEGIALSKARTQIHAASTASRVFARDGKRPEAHALLTAVAREAHRRDTRKVAPALLLQTALADPDSPAVRTLRALGSDPDAILARLDDDGSRNGPAATAR